MVPREGPQSSLWELFEVCRWLGGCKVGMLGCSVHHGPRSRHSPNHRPQLEGLTGKHAWCWTSNTYCNREQYRSGIATEEVCMSHSLRMGGGTALFQATEGIKLVKRLGNGHRQQSTATWNIEELWRIPRPA